MPDLTESVDLERVVITRPMVFTLGLMGLAAAQVCVAAEVPDVEILAECNYRCPSGTEHGWVKVIREADAHFPAPVPCAQHPDRLHIIVVC